MDFEGSHGVHPVGHDLMTRLSRRRLGVTSARGIIGFDHARMTSRQSEGSMLGETPSSVVALWTGTTCRCVRASAICVRITQRSSRSRQVGRGRPMCPIALLPHLELQHPQEKLLGGGQCFGAVVELEVVDALGLPG